MILTVVLRQHVMLFFLICLTILFLETVSHQVYALAKPWRLPAD